MLPQYDCPWYILDNSLKTLLGSCLVVLGVVGVVMNIWMSFTFLHSHLLSFKSHILVLNLCTACLGKGVLGGFAFAGPSAIIGRWLFGNQCCQLFAFLHQLLGVFQIAALTVLCYERYLLTKKMMFYGRDICMKFYVGCIAFCWIYSILLSTPPYVGYGNFTCDISGTSCTLDWRHTSRKQSAFIIPLVVFEGVLPTIVILATLWRALILGRKRKSNSEEWEQYTLTRTTTFMACTLLLLWLPQAILSSWIWLSGIGMWTGSYFVRGPPPSLVLLAPLASETSTMVPLLCYLAGEPRIRTALLGRCKSDYGIIKRGRRRSGRRSS